MSDIAEIIGYYIAHPEELGRQVGFRDLTPLHGDTDKKGRAKIWIRMKGKT